MQNKFSKDTYLHWYELMLLLRKFELKAGQLYGMQKIRGFCHLYMGQEAVAAGAISASKPDDKFITAYRDHALAIAKGVSSKATMAELFGKATGCSKGKGGSMHMFSKEHNFFGGHGIVGGQIGVSAGLAFAEKYKKTDNIVICFFGDGAARQGVVHETFNMAMLWNLPIVVVCENNKYAMGTSVERTSNVQDIALLGGSYKMPSDTVDGMSCEAVHKSLDKAVKRARKGDGPTLLDVKTYRYRGHSMSDPAKYRTKEEVKKYKEKDPINQVLNTIKDKKYASEEEIEAIKSRVDEEVAEAVKYAEDSPFPEDDELLKDIYVEDDYPFITD
ncbi:MAG TPA: pyruvate dehydrogenase (acetyl-transferring) E1 component subunit alpha [Chitinophagaceae bacterium]|nr:pyruvate dehydrogenase (acetyl-transferring) E1 component subunit alpha [Chitinophagaceae bacterium]